MGGAALFFAISMLILCWPLRNASGRANVMAYCMHPMTLVKKLEPVHVIILGLAISVAGVVWSFYRSQPKKLSAEQVAAITAPLTAELNQLRTRIAAAPQPVVKPAPAAPQPKRYTAYEKEQRLRAIDEIFGVITSKLSPAFTEGQELFRLVQAGGADDTTPIRLIDHANTVKIAFDDLLNLYKKYEYFSDIISVAQENTFNGLLEINGSQNLAQEIGFVKNNMVPHANKRDIWNRDMILFEANNANRDFGNFLTETLPRLKQKRNEIESTEIYAGQQ